MNTNCRCYCLSMQCFCRKPSQDRNVSAGLTTATTVPAAATGFKVDPQPKEHPFSSYYKKLGYFVTAPCVKFTSICVSLLLLNSLSQLLLLYRSTCIFLGFQCVICCLVAGLHVWEFCIPLELNPISTNFIFFWPTVCSNLPVKRQMRSFHSFSQCYSSSTEFTAICLGELVSFSSSISQTFEDLSSSIPSKAFEVNS